MIEKYVVMVKLKYFWYLLQEIKGSAPYDEETRDKTPSIISRKRWNGIMGHGLQGTNLYAVR
jgi:hypothetical protein